MSPTATEEEIRAAYKDAARAMHPDKHSANPELKEYATKRFGQLVDASNVLLDKGKRAIYDAAGEEGLRIAASNDFAVGAHLRAPAELAELLERLKTRARRRKVEAETGAGSNVSCHALLRRGRDGSLVYTPRILIAMQSLTLALSDRTSLTGHFTSLLGQRRNGGYEFGANLRHDWSEAAWSSIVLEGGLRPRISAKTSRKYSEHAWLHAVAKLKDGGPAASFRVSRQVFEHCNSSIGPYVDMNGSGMKLSISRSAGEAEGVKGTTVSTTMKVGKSWLGGPFSEGSLRLSRPLSTRSSAHLSTRLSEADGSGSWELEAGASRVVSSNTSIGLNLAMGATGVTVRMRVSRGAHSFQIPLLLPYDDHGAPFLAAAAALPCAASLLIARLVLRPRESRRRRREVARRRAAAAAMTAASRAEAISDVRLIMRESARRRQIEQSRNGVVVIVAYYGILPKSGPPPPPPQPTSAYEDGYAVWEGLGLIEVTTPIQVCTTPVVDPCLFSKRNNSVLTRLVQYLVQDSALRLFGTTKVCLMWQGCRMCCGVISAFVGGAAGFSRRCSWRREEAVCALQVCLLLVVCACVFAESMHPSVSEAESMRYGDAL